MTEGATLLSARFSSARPGLELLAVEDAALPVTVVYAEVLAQERKPLPLLEEFVLRLLSAGLSTPAKVAATLGLDESLVNNAIADQVSKGNIAYSAAHTRVSLTPLGVQACQDLEAVQPRQMQLPVTFDRLTWTIADYRQQELLSKKSAQEMGMIILPALRSARIGGDDVQPAGINRLLRGQGARQSRIEVLTIRKLSTNTHRYLPVQLLVFGDADGGEVELSVVIDDEVATEHDLKLAGLGGAERLAIKVGKTVERPTLSDDLEAQRIDSAAVALADRIPDSPLDRANSSANALVRSVGVFEHRDLLETAMTSATRRLLIISPWVKSAVANTDFLTKLETRLRRGCLVDIGHGYGDDDSGSDANALKKLNNLAARYPERFHLTRLTNTHAKILIFDSVWITTSFNWLSFKGDPDRTYRMEEGTMVTIADRVDVEYDKYKEMLLQQRKV